MVQEISAKMIDNWLKSLIFSDFLIEVYMKEVCSFVFQESICHALWHPLPDLLRPCQSLALLKLVINQFMNQSQLLDYSEISSVLQVKWFWDYVDKVIGTSQSNFISSWIHSDCLAKIN